MGVNKNEFGKYIRNRREKLGLRLKDIAIKLDCSVVYISDIEVGKRPAPVNNKLEKLASILNVEYGELIEKSSKDRQKVELEINNRSKKIKEMALVIARTWNTLDDSKAERISNYITGVNMAKIPVPTRAQLKEMAIDLGVKTLWYWTNKMIRNACNDKVDADNRAWHRASTIREDETRCCLCGFVDDTEEIYINGRGMAYCNDCHNNGLAT